MSERLLMVHFCSYSMCTCVLAKYMVKMTAFIGPPASKNSVSLS